MANTKSKISTSSRRAVRQAKAAKNSIVRDSRVVLKDAKSAAARAGTRLKRARTSAKAAVVSVIRNKRVRVAAATVVAVGAAIAVVASRRKRK